MSSGRVRPISDIGECMIKAWIVRLAFTSTDYLDMRLTIVATVLSLVAFNTFAGWFGFGGTSWKEEVLLHDGSKLVVERSVSRGGPHEIGQRGSYTKETLAFTHPVSGKRVTWEDIATADLGNSNFLPMALDVYQDAAYLVAYPMGCLSYNKWGRPNPPYVVFKLTDRTWTRIALRELPSETTALNLLFSSPDTEVENLGRHFVDAETIKRIATEYSQPEFKAILRDEITMPESGCTKMDYYPNAGWLGPDWFSRQPSLDACLQFCERRRIAAELCPCKDVFKASAAR